jgi:hypothetical protein
MLGKTRISWELDSDTKHGTVQYSNILLKPLFSHLILILVYYLSFISYCVYISEAKKTWKPYTASPMTTPVWWTRRNTRWAMVRYVLTALLKILLKTRRTTFSLIKSSEYIKLIILQNTSLYTRFEYTLNYIALTISLQLFSLEVQ